MNMGPFGTHFDRNCAWAKEMAAWSSYVARCHATMRRMRPIAPVGCFKGEENSGNVPDPRLPPFSIPSTHGADMLSPWTLRSLRARDGRAVNAEGVNYRLLVLPPMPAATVTTMGALVALADAGVPIVATTLPSRAVDAPEDGSADAVVQQLSAQLRCHIVAPDSAEALTMRSIEPDLAYRGTRTDAALNFSRGTLLEGPAWFVANDRRRSEEVVVRLPAGPRPLELWWPERDLVEPLPTPEPDADGTVEIALSFPPCGSVLIRPSCKLGSASIQRVGARPYRWAEIPISNTELCPDIADDFTIALWINPETVMLPGRGYLFHPVEGTRAFGDGNAACGLAAGRNGIVVVERTTGAPSTVLEIRTPIGGWTHVVLTYRQRTPALYIDGKQVDRGARSAARVHPGLGAPAILAQTMTRFEGDATSPVLIPRALSDGEIEELARAPMPPPERARSAELRKDAGRIAALIRSNGDWSVRRGRAAVSRRILSVYDEDLSQGWQVAFEPGRGAPAGLQIPVLETLSRHPDPTVAHFSGRATWSRRFDIGASVSDQRQLLDRGASRAWLRS